MIPLQSLGGYSENLALALGVLAVVVVIGYALATRWAGWTEAEREHHDAFTDGLELLPRSAHAAVDDADGRARIDIETLAASDETVPFYKRPVGWFLRRVHRAWVQGHRCVDADGRPIYVVSVTGTRLAHRDIEALAADALVVAQHQLDGETPPGTLSEYFFQDALEGRVDIEETEARVHGDCKTRLAANLAREQSLDYDDLVERMVYDFRYPPAVYRDALDDIAGRDARVRKDGSVTWQRYG